MIGIFRKVSGVLFLSVGACFILAISMSFYYGISEYGFSLRFLMFYLILVIVPTLAGLGLWGLSRWRAVLGTIFTVTGGLLIFIVITVLLLKISPEKKLIEEAISAQQLEMMKYIIYSSSISGLVFLVLGIAFLMKQKRIDGK